MLHVVGGATVEGGRGRDYITTQIVAQRTADIWSGFFQKSANFILGCVTQQHTPDLIEPAVQSEGLLQPDRMWACGKY